MTRAEADRLEQQLDEAFADRAYWVKQRQTDPVNWHHHSYKVYLADVMIDMLLNDPDEEPDIGDDPCPGT